MQEAVHSLLCTHNHSSVLCTHNPLHTVPHKTQSHMAGQGGRKREKPMHRHNPSQSLSLTAPHTHTVRLSSPLQSITCSTHSPSWMQSLAHSQSLTHCPLQSCQLSCNRNRMSDLSEKEERCVLHRAPELSVYHGRGGMESLTSWRDRKGPEQDTPFQTHFFSYAFLPQLCQSPFGFGHHQ